MNPCSVARHALLDRCLGRYLGFYLGLCLAFILIASSAFAQTGASQPGAVPPSPAQLEPAPSNSPQPSVVQPAQTRKSTPAASSILPPAGDPVGNVATLTGSATISRFGNSTPLKTNDDIYLGDTLQTDADSALGVTFTDDTTFKLSANARIVVNKYLYEEGGKNNSALFNVARGTVAFVASAVAKTGDMKIATPTATLGIRGTTGVIDVPDNVSANGNDVAIKLYPDQDGRVGHIEVNGRDGNRLGLLSQASSGFAIRSGAGGRFTAAPLQISPQIAARDLGYVRQVHAAQGIGRQIVSQQRTLRLQNPSRQNSPQRGPGALQRQNGTGPARQPPGPQRPQPGERPKQSPRQTQPETAPKKSEQRPNGARPSARQQPAGMQRTPGMPGAVQPRLPRQPGLSPRAPQGTSKPQRAPKNPH
ncbi:MAG TPA: FecR domain-containing protein [Afipia sp.]